MLIFVPWIGLMFFGNRLLPEIGARAKLWLKLLLAVPALNYLSTLSFRNLVGWEQTSFGWHIVTSINGVCLAAALTVVIIAALKKSKTLDPA